MNIISDTVVSDALYMLGGPILGCALSLHSNSHTSLQIWLAYRFYTILLM